MILKRFIALVSFAMCFMTLEANAQFVYAIGGGGGHSAATTQLSDVRYEFIQAPTNSAQAFLVDKFEGKVWKFKRKQKEFNEIELEGANLVDATKVNYQLYISAADSNQCFLLNVHTGEMWQYNAGEKTFKKLEMPFLAPKEE